MIVEVNKMTNWMKEKTNQGKLSLQIDIPSNMNKRRRRNVVDEEEESDVDVNDLEQRENSTEENNPTEEVQKSDNRRETRSTLRDVDNATQKMMKQVQNRSLSYQFQFFASLGKEKGKK